MPIKLRKNTQKTAKMLSFIKRERMIFMKEKDIKKELHIFAKELQSKLNSETLQMIGEKHSFSRRKSKFQTAELVALCVWLSQQVATTSLTQLSSLLEVQTGISITAEALNQRFNHSAVMTLKEIFSSLLSSEFKNPIFNCLNENFPFKRLRLLDSTTFQLPDMFSSSYRGFGGSSHTAGIKIQLEYDLFNGQFLNIYAGAGSKNDKTYGSECLESIQKEDLCIRDLGYFDLKDLYMIEKQGAFFVSRIKLNTRIYTKNSTPKTCINGEIKKYSMYKLLDLEAIMNKLKPGETIEIESVYCGNCQKLPARLICYRLTEEQLKNRRKKQIFTAKKKGFLLTEKSKHLSGLNVYITNISSECIKKEKIHNLYSLRWQIELLFKTWKSLFGIQHCKKIKKERLECHLYGQLISILISSTTMFKIRKLLYEKDGEELSEYKGIYVVKAYLTSLYEALKKSTQRISEILFRLFNFLRKNGRKSHRYEKKTAIDILSTLC